MCMCMSIYVEYQSIWSMWNMCVSVSESIKVASGE